MHANSGVILKNDYVCVLLEADALERMEKSLSRLGWVAFVN